MLAPVFEAHKGQPSLPYLIPVPVSGFCPIQGSKTVAGDRQRPTSRHKWGGS